MKYEVFTNSDKSFKPMSKKLLFSFFLTLSVSLSVVGQISLVDSIQGGGDRTFNNVKFTDFGEKFYVTFRNPTTNVYTSRLIILNDNYTVFKNIFLPSGFRCVYFFDNRIIGLSDKLFNSNSLIEFIVEDTLGNSYVMDETGGIVYSLPSNQGCLGIKKVNNSYGLCTYSYGNFPNPGYLYFYSLPGTLPCDQCGGISGLEQPNTGGLGEMKVYPNPFNNTLQVNYDFPTNQSNPRLILTDILGRELREIKLTSQTDNVSINTSDLPKGTIIVSLYGGQNMISKKVIKID